VVDKASEWHHYTIEREGKRRKATTSQLKKFHSSEIDGDIRFAAQREDANDSEPVSGFFEIENTPEEIPLTDYSGLRKPCYEAATYPLGEDCEPDSEELTRGHIGPSVATPSQNGRELSWLPDKEVCGKVRWSWSWIPNFVKTR
jgi:hypothetical protein